LTGISTAKIKGFVLEKNLLREHVEIQPFVLQWAGEHTLLRGGEMAERWIWQKHGGFDFSGFPSFRLARSGQTREKGRNCAYFEPLGINGLQRSPRQSKAVAPSFSTPPVFTALARDTGPMQTAREAVPPKNQGG
jgi:hypothetical protein